MHSTFKQVMVILGPKARRRLAILGVATLVAAFWQLVGIGSVVPLVAAVSKPALLVENPDLARIVSLLGLTDTSDGDRVTALSLLMVVVIGMGNGLNIWVNWFQMNFNAQEVRKVSRRLLANYSYRPYTFFLSNNSSSLSRDILTEVPKLFSGFIGPLISLQVSLVTILIVSAGLFLVDPLAAVGFAVVFGGGYTLIYRLCRAYLQRIGRERLEASRVKFKVTNEMLSGQREVRLLDCRRPFLEVFQEAEDRIVTAGVHAGLISQIPRQVLEILGFLMIAGLVWVFRITDRETGMILPLLSIYAVGAVRLLPHFQNIFHALAQLRYNKPVLERLTPELVESLEETDSPVANPLQWETELALRSLFFKYPESENNVLADFSCTLKKNSVVGFVGSTGAGKTTLINILLGLLEPTSGKIEVDGRKLDAKLLKEWQAQLGFVPQEIFLCDDTIAANVAFGDLAPDADRVCAALELAAMNQFVDSLPEGVNTFVGERGVRLSGGQRQRLGIARALYRDPQTLIFDEATSSLDSITETAIMDAVSNLEGDKTIILIAHRVTTLKGCDVIYVLEEGRIVDSGTYEELLVGNITFQGFAQEKAGAVPHERG